MDVIMASFGNDSLALIQWVREQRDESKHDWFQDVTVLYNNTGWAAPWWKERVEECSNWVQQLGFKFAETESEGFMNLVRRKQAFPMNGAQFCTEHLKRIPSMEWLDKNAPKKSRVLVGVRRCESEKRKDFPEYVAGSLDHGGRDVWAPLVDYTDEDRDRLLADAGFEPLPHRSMECYPCVNANRNDLRMLDEDRIRLIEVFEEEMGVGKRSGNPKYMFRAANFQGNPKGIRNVIKWANDGKYIEGQEDFWGSGCDGGFCE